MGGFACARTLRRAGCYLELFERDKTVAGRMGTARLGLTAFDHGSEYITARGGRFRRYLDELVTTGYPAQWSPKLAVGDVARAATEAFRVRPEGAVITVAT